MLSPLQERVAEIIAGLDEARDFALAGGGALIVRGDVQRQTRDLDFFGLTAEAVDELVPAADRALQAAGFTVRHIQESHGFARLIVESGEDRTELDLGTDARLFPIEPGSPAPLLSGEELAVDKVLAVFGRAEARDFADLMAIEPRYGRRQPQHGARACPAAQHRSATKEAAPQASPASAATSCTSCCRPIGPKKAQALPRAFF